MALPLSLPLTRTCTCTCTSICTYRDEIYNLRGIEVLSIADLPSLPSLLSFARNILFHHAAPHRTALRCMHRYSCRIVDSIWVWTEPHSKRIKVAVTIEKEVLKVFLQQKVVVEFVVHSKQCMTCIRENTDHTWGAMVQVRQRAGGVKSSLYQLEGLLLKAGMQHLMLNVTARNEGFDLFFKSRNQAEKVVDLIMTNMPCKKSNSSKLVSQDKKANTKHMELTTMLEIVPVAKFDLVVLPRGLNGGRPMLALCHKLSSNLHLVSPQTLARCEVSATKYYAQPFAPIMRGRDLVEYIILDITPVGGAHYGAGAATAEEAVATGATLGSKKPSKKAAPKPTASAAKGVFCLATAEIMRANGDGDSVFTVMTHLGAVLAAGDTCMGYNVQAANLEDDALEGLALDAPDVVLVRKVYPADEGKKARKRRKRAAPWMSKQGAGAAGGGDAEGVGGEGEGEGEGEGGGERSARGEMPSFDDDATGLSNFEEGDEDDYEDEDDDDEEREDDGEEEVEAEEEQINTIRGKKQ